MKHRLFCCFSFIIFRYKNGDLEDGIEDEEDDEDDNLDLDVDVIGDDEEDHIEDDEELRRERRARKFTFLLALVYLVCLLPLNVLK